MFIDSHCHLYYEPYINNLDATLSACNKNNVKKLLSIGINIETSKKNIEISIKYNEIFCTIGIHPNEVKNCKNNDYLELKKIYKKNHKIIGIGEIGYDFFKSTNSKNQEIFFIEQIEIALEHNLPIVIHSRNAEQKTIDTLKKYKNSNLKFIVHCFTGTERFADEILNLDGYISFTGILTFKKSEILRNICRKIPIERLLIETDSPYLSPEPFRGKVNCPSNVIYVAKQISETKGLNIDQIEKITTNNFNTFFNL